MPETKLPKVGNTCSILEKGKKITGKVTKVENKTVFIQWSDIGHEESYNTDSELERTEYNTIIFD